MSDTTPTPRSPESESSTDESTARHRTGEQPLTTSPDPADRTDTATAPAVPPGYDPVAASGHVAPGPAFGAIAEQSEVADAAPAAPVEESAPLPPAAEPVAEPVAAPPAPEPVPEPVPEPAPDAYAGPTYLQTPQAPPAKRSNRGLGILIAVLGVVVFAAANLAASYGILVLRYGASRAQSFLEDYLTNWEFWVPLAVFAAAFIVLVAIVNRGRWWGYVLGSVFVAALVFAGYYGAALLTNRIWERTPAEFDTFTRDYFQSNIPYLWVATVVSFIALEVVIWLGAWIAFHGQNAKRRNVEARAAYEAELEQSSVR